jgi:hypothetical protein
MKWLAIALVCAAGIIGVETYLLLEKPEPPPPPPLRVIAIPPPAPPSPPPLRPIAKRKVIRATAQRPGKAPRPDQLTTGSQKRPFIMPTGGIFSGVDPQDPRIYHFAELGK